jgi:hypothetical protein
MPDASPQVPLLGLGKQDDTLQEAVVWARGQKKEGTRGMDQYGGGAHSKQGLLLPYAQNSSCLCSTICFKLK